VHFLAIPMIVGLNSWGSALLASKSQTLGDRPLSPKSHMLRDRPSFPW